MGRVHGHRGNRGEMTVRVPAGDASLWSGVTRVRFQVEGEDSSHEEYSVDSARAYRDRLVLKLAGIDDGNAAERWRGAELRARASEAAPLGEDEFFIEDLVGRVVETEDGTRIGEVRRVLPTGGVDLLELETDRGALLVPLAREIVTHIDDGGRRIVIRPPEGLLELNRSEGK